MAEMFYVLLKFKYFKIFDDYLSSFPQPNTYRSKLTALTVLSSQTIKELKDKHQKVRLLYDFTKFSLFTESSLRWSDRFCPAEIDKY